MKPLAVLLATFLLATIILRIIRKRYEYALPARIAMSVMLVFTAIGHSAFAKGMAMMLPSFIPYKTEVVYLTGMTEVLAAIGLLLPPISRRTA